MPAGNHSTECLSCGEILPPAIAPSADELGLYRHKGDDVHSFFFVGHCGMR